MNYAGNTIKVYDTIQAKAGSNQVMQAISGVFGFPVNLIVDGGVVFTHYAPMLNEIRRIYGRSSISKEVIVPILKGCTAEILTDLAVDKVIGSIPLIGIGANIMCAKTLTWRLGLVFAMVSARGEELTADSISKATKAVRVMFPQKNMFRFATPSIVIVDKLINSVEDISVEDFDDKLSRILDSL